MKFIFLHADKQQSFYKLALSFLMEVARHVQSNQSTKSGIYLQYIKKKVSQLLSSSLMMQNIQDVLRRSRHVRRCLFLIETFVKAKAT